MPLFAWAKQKALSERLSPRNYPPFHLPHVAGMITDQEQHALASFAQHIWNYGARDNGLIIDGGCYIGASTVALAEGLRHSSLSENKRAERIRSYDLFRATPAMAEHYLKDAGLKAGDSFQPIFEKNVAAYKNYIKVCAGDIRNLPVPAQPVSILFLDILWSWDCTDFIARNFYPLLDSGRSLLIHQDFVYPFYPWVILSMGLLKDAFSFAYNIQYSSVVFDVKRKLSPDKIEDPRNMSLAKALATYDDFIDRINGWGKGALTLGKALYLASLNQIQDAKTIINQVAAAYANESLVTQYLEFIRGYCDQAVSTGRPVPLDQAVGI